MLVVEEVSEASIISQRIKVIINLSCSQEIITRPFTRPNLRGAREIIFGLLILLTLFILRASARRAPQKSLHHFLKISKILVTQNKSETNSTKLIATTPTSA